MSVGVSTDTYLLKALEFDACFYSLAWAYLPCPEDGLYDRSSPGRDGSLQLTNTDVGGLYLQWASPSDAVEMTKRLKKYY